MKEPLQFDTNNITYTTKLPITWNNIIDTPAIDNIIIDLTYKNNANNIQSINKFIREN